MRFTSALTTLPLSLLHYHGYTLILLGTFLESIPFFGAFIPGNSLIIFGGFLAKIHVLNVVGVIGVSAMAAILGDLTAYALGRQYGYDLLIRYGKYVSIQPAHLEKAKHLVAHHLGKILIIGRFYFVTRSIAPFVVGASKVAFYRFFTFSVIGDTCWAIISVLIGYVFGASFQIAAQHLHRMTMIVSLVALGGGLGYWLYLRNKKRISK